LDITTGSDAFDAEMWRERSLRRKEEEEEARTGQK
jgi:hypothetical protein